MPPVDPQANAAFVVRTLRDAGHVAYFAGGCVRDQLLGLTPKDYDVATDAPPARVQELFKKTQAVGAAFGVILVRLGGSLIEVATFRSDGTYEDGRRPESVTFSTAEQDAQRRDFTINGLFFDPVESKVIDYVNGQADLAAKTLRAIGNPAERFNEDHLRLLRAVRFAARFGLTIEQQTAAAMDAAAPLLGRISAERIAEELRKILAAATRDSGYCLLWRHGFLRSVLPTIATNQAPLDESKSLLLALSPGEPITFALAWLATMIDLRQHASAFPHDLLGNLTETNTAAIVRLSRDRLKLSNDELDAMTDIARWCHAVLSTDSPDDAILKRFLARATSPQARQLLDALHSVGIARDRIDMLRPRLGALAETDFAPPPLLSGDDLIRAGFRPGRAFKHILHEVYDAQLNGTIKGAAQAMTLADQIRKSSG